MLDKKFFTQIKKQYAATATDRRRVAALSSEAQQLAKQAIFAMQRADLVQAKKLIAQSQNLIVNCKKIRLANSELDSQGSFRAALEEYVEAALFFQALTGGRGGPLPKINVPLETYLGGLADMVGEITRRSVILVTEGKYQEVRALAKIAAAAVGELAQMNLVGYLRNKFDQANQALRKLESILYDLSLQNKWQAY